MRTHDHIVAYGVLLLVMGSLLRYFVGRRRFNRRGMAGLQQFPSYGHGVVIRLMEKLILFIGNLCLLSGLLLLVLTGFNHHFKF